jgi:putative ABC transport system substrate-binding protein
VLAVLSPTHGEAADRIWRVGVLTLVDDDHVHSVILPDLASRGFVEGRNLLVDFRVGTAERMPELARALASDKPDVIIAVSDWAMFSDLVGSTALSARFADEC